MARIFLNQSFELCGDFSVTTIRISQYPIAFQVHELSSS